MHKSSSQAGRNIRALAIKRRVKAIASFASAGLILFLPFFLIKRFERFFYPISSLNHSQAQPSLNFLPLFYVAFTILALGCVGNGIFLWKRANHADQGAKGEEYVALEMLSLEQEGWQVEFNMRLGGRLGDVDIVCISPQNKAYAIEVKSHRGEVTTDGQKLYRRMGKTTYPFEKNFLEQAMKQALQVKKQKSLKFVNAIVAFSDAKVSVSSGKLNKVFVVEKSGLVPLLKSLE